MQRIGVISKSEEVRKVHMRERRRQHKVLRMGVVPGRAWGAKAPGMVPTQGENVLGICPVPSGTDVDKPLQRSEEGYEQV